jgi:hypothetical protein
MAAANKKKSLAAAAANEAVSRWLLAVYKP